MSARGWRLWPSWAAFSLAGCSVVLGIEQHPLGDPFASEVFSGDSGTLGGDALPGEGDGSAIFEGGIIVGDGAVNPFDATTLEPPGCQLSPTTDVGVLEERCGVFVSSTGNDGNDGTRAAPLKTIGAGVQAAIAKKLYRAFICGDLFVERVSMATEGVSLVGGFACSGASWTVAPTVPVVRAPDTGVALRINGSTNAVVIESLRFESLDATGASASSIAAFVTNAASVTFVRSALAAGAGTNGTDGAGGSVGTGGGAGGNAGGVGGVYNVGATVTCNCTLDGNAAGTTTGGNGGVYPNTGAGAGTPGLGGGAGGVFLAPCAGGGNGGNGAGGAAGTTPAPSAALGAISDTGWTPTFGTDGTAGSIGQGGGGGTSGTGGRGIQFAGGSGGCGGCPSSGGKAGSGGGGSIAVLSSGANVALVDSALFTKAGGKGGNGGIAPAPQGGGGGAGNVYGYGCTGGTGGSGGKGGDGAGGAGGVSVGILYKGAPPVLDATSQAKVSLGAAGAAGTGGAPASAGVSQATLAQ